MKYLLVIGDGMADNPVPQLGGKTPLEVANKPVMDALCKNSKLGSVINCPKPLPAGSETAIMSIFGYDPRAYFTGRSPMEAAASGIKLEAGDVAYRMNLVTVEDDKNKPWEQKKILSHSAGSIVAEDAFAAVDVLEHDEKFSSLLERAKMTIHRFPAFRQIPVQKGADIDGLCLIPPHDHLGEVIAPLLPTGNETAKLLREMMHAAHEALDGAAFNERRRSEGKLPANGIWFWAHGTAVALPQFREKYGHWGGVISAVPLCHGIGVLAGLEMIEVEGATGEIDTNFEGKRDRTIELLKRTDMDFVCLHLEAPDECTHNGDLEGKITAIEWLDSKLLKPITDYLKQSGTDYRMLVLSDHKTLTATRGHDADPVPYFIYDSTNTVGCGLPYTEANGLKGTLTENGADLMSLLFDKET